MLIVGEIWVSWNATFADRPDRLVGVFQLVPIQGILRAISVESGRGIWLPVGHRLAQRGNHAAVGGLALAESKLEAELVVMAAPIAHRCEKLVGRDAAILVVLRRERPVASLVHGRLLDVNDRRLGSEASGPGIGVDIGGVG